MAKRDELMRKSVLIAKNGKKVVPRAKPNKPAQHGWSVAIKNVNAVDTSD